MACDSRVEQIGREEMKHLETQRAALRRELAEIERRLGAWAVILEKSSDSVADHNQPVVTLRPERVTTLPGEMDERGKTLRQPITSVAKKIMEHAGSFGFEPKDITQGLVKEGFTVHSTVGSNIIHRLRSRGEVIQVHGKYYLAGYTPDSSIAMHTDQQQTPP